MSVAIPRAVVRVVPKPGALSTPVPVPGTSGLGSCLPCEEKARRQQAMTMAGLRGLRGIEASSMVPWVLGGGFVLVLGTVLWLAFRRR